jgi:hypothetical protein
VKDDVTAAPTNRVEQQVRVTGSPYRTPIFPKIVSMIFAEFEALRPIPLYEMEVSEDIHFE